MQVRANAIVAADIAWALATPKGTAKPRAAAESTAPLFFTFLQRPVMSLHGKPLADLDEPFANNAARNASWNAQKEVSQAHRGRHSLDIAGSESCVRRRPVINIAAAPSPSPPRARAPRCAI